jgi:exodeoxyribonuclease VII small subunit
MAGKSDKKPKTLTFEQSLEKLEEIVTEIESGEVPLEESIEKYAEGMGLVKQCRGILDQAEKRIQLLSRGEGDDAVAVDGELDELDEDMESDEEA